MPFQNDPVEGTVIEVLLRFRDENGVIDRTERETLKRETRFLIFERDADRGIGELNHPFAFVSWVVPLGQSTYRLEDLWHGHPMRLDEKEEAPGGLAFKDAFVAERLADGSLLFDRVVQRGNWRIDSWMLVSASFVQYLQAAKATIEAHGGYAEQDPWITNWFWTFLPPEIDYDPDSDIRKALESIPRTELERIQNELPEEARRSDGESPFVVKVR